MEASIAVSDRLIIPSLQRANRVARRIRPICEPQGVRIDIEDGISLA